MKTALLIVAIAILLNGALLYCCLRVGKRADDQLHELSPKHTPDDLSEK